MGMSTGGGKGPISEINVTPFVDVMLVLLIIFMFTAPLLYNGIEMNLPKTKEVNRINMTSKQVILSLTELNKLYLGPDPVPYADVIGIIQTKFKENNSNTVFLRADAKIAYGKVAKLMSHLKGGGIKNISLITEIDK